MASRICHVKPIASAAIAAPITVIFHRVFSGRIERVGELASGMSTITGLVHFYGSKHPNEPLLNFPKLIQIGIEYSSIHMQLVRHQQEISESAISCKITWQQAKVTIRGDRERGVVHCAEHGHCLGITVSLEIDDCLFTTIPSESDGPW
jgi:hypothetical protein